MTDNLMWVLEFTVPGMREPYQVTFTEEIIVGRAGPDIKVDVDLNPFDAAAKGVSRQHIAIAPENESLYIRDLGASNGTMLNDKRLKAHEKQHLATDDELSLGALKMKVRIVGAPTMANATRKQTNISRSGDAPPGNGELVLIVEDHLEVAQLFSMMLQRQGFTTQISRDANRAMRFLQTHNPQAVVLDLMLPGMNGVEVCRYIRRDSTLDQTPIVAVSANREVGVEAEILAAGADIFLSKPVNATELGEVIAEFIQRRGGGSNSPTHGSKDATKALDEAKSNLSISAVRDDMVAVIVAGFTDRPFTVTLNRPMTFGRSGAGSAATHIDLSDYGAGDRGVSRVHMLMSYEDGTFYVEDAGSLNGTFVGGEQIPPHTRVSIFSGQQVRLGRLGMFIYFLSETEEDDPIQSTGEFEASRPGDTRALDEDKGGTSPLDEEDDDDDIPMNDYGEPLYGD
ncbi:MAG: FHA domain-containing protein [Chloroflexota bacterium]